MGGVIAAIGTPAVDPKPRGLSRSLACGESGPEGGFPAVGNRRTRRGVPPDERKATVPGWPEGQPRLRRIRYPTVNKGTAKQKKQLSKPA